MTIPNASIYVKEAVVSVTNVANPSTGNVGNTGTFTLTATNNGPDSATNVVITDPLPSGFTAGTPSQGTYDAATGVWNIGTLANSASVTLTFTGTLAANQAGTTIINSATESQDEYPPVTIPNASIYVNEANVTLSQTGGYSGSVVTFIVTASNQGPDSASNMRITDVIPSGLTNVIVTPSVGTYVGGVWTIPSLAKGATATLNITGTSVSPSTTVNNATLTNQTEYNPNKPMLVLLVCIRLLWRLR